VFLCPLLKINKWSEKYFLQRYFELILTFGIDWHHICIIHSKRQNKCVMKTLQLFFIALSLGLLTQCSSGKKAFENGDYYSAVIKSVNRLRQNPDHKKSKTILSNAYNYALKHLEEDAQRIISSNDQFKYCEALEKYDMINQMHDDIRKSPGALSVIKNPKNYFSKADELTELAAQERYDAGDASMARNTRRDAKDAYYYYQEANDYVPGFKDVNNKIDESLFMATLKVVVEQIPVPASYTLSSNFFQDQVESYLHDRYNTNKFVRFYSQEEADSEDLNIVDEYMKVAFDDFVVGQTFVNQKTETFTKDSVVVGQVTLEDGTSIDAYNTVSATLSTWHKETVSQGLLSMRIYDAQTNAMIRHEKFDGKFIWISDWGNFNGDERALSQEQINVCNSTEALPPPPQTLFVEFTRPIYDQLTRAISRYYNKF
jgi:hypothetical protein